MRQIPILNLQICITNSCNLNCAYCFQEHSEQSFDYMGFKKSIETIFSNITPQKLTVMFCGGEPFLAFGIMKQIVSFLESYVCDIPIYYYLTTNGTILNRDIIQFIAEHDVDVSISLDGTREAQDSNRRFLNGGGTFDVVKKNIQMLSICHIPIKIKTVISDWSSLTDVYRYIKKEWDPDTLFISECIGSDVEKKSKEDILNYRNAWMQILDLELESFKLTGKWSLEKFSLLLRRIYAKNVNVQFCNAGNCTYSIFLNGDIYPCYRATDCEKFKLSSDNIELNECFIQQSTSLKMATYCKDCEMIKFCGGGCAINAHKYGEGIENPYEPDCQLNKMYGELTLYLFGKIIRLPNIEAKKIFKLPT